MMKKTLYMIVLGLALAVSPLKSVQAEGLFGLWFKPRLDFVSGTGEVFDRFEGSTAGGAELGLTLLGVSLWGDIGFMSSDQYWSSVNLGYDMSFGEKFKVTLGAYAGLLWFQFPKSEGGSAGLTNEMSSSLMMTLPEGTYQEFESAYNDAFSDFDEISDNAMGINARARLALEYKLVSALSIGVQGLFGYHYILSGDDAASSAKGIAVDAFVDSQGLSASVEGDRLKTELKEALGAEDKGLDDLQGVHYSVGAFVNLSF